ncbi:MAG: putative DNA binding domain-containing protein [Oscillospiraceae bacterium]|nr:putative DNA binding domain-containing protein [Oscillospiraceae bacterium]
MKKERFDLSRFDEYREGNRLEVKKAGERLPDSLWETYSSFSNCSGGVIVLGAAERRDGSWYTTHIQDPDKLLKDFWNTVNNRKKVSINLLDEEDVKLYEYNGDTILVITVPKADRVYKPVYINDDLFRGTFRRDHEGDYHCSEAEVRGMLRDQAERSTDSRILLNMETDIFFRETVKSYRTRHMAVNPQHVWHRLDDEAYLERIGAASVSDVDNRLHPTVAGLLMFGEEYIIRREFPEYFLDYREILDPSIRWTDRLESSSGEWSGNLLDYFFSMERRLLRDVQKPFMMDGITRIDETDIHRAIREALANCIANADFNFPRGIVIIKKPESLSIENPGSIITGRAQMLKGGISEPRNKIIMKMFNLIRIGERAGSGVPDIFATWQDAGLLQPTVTEQFKPDRTVVILPVSGIISGKSGNKRQTGEKTSGKSENKRQTDGKTSGKSENKRQTGEKTSGKSENKRQTGEKTSGKSENKRQTDEKTSGKPENKRQTGEKTSGKSENKRQTGKKTSGKSNNKRQNGKQAASGRSDGNKERIYALLEGLKRASTAEISAAVGLSASRTRALLSELERDGRITHIGESRARAYVLPEE